MGNWEWQSAWALCNMHVCLHPFQDSPRQRQEIATMKEKREQRVREWEWKSAWALCMY